MAKVHRLASRDELEETAGRWIARLEADDVSDDDRRRFAVWLDEDRRHRETFEAMRHSWHRLDALGTLANGIGTSENRPAAVPTRARRRRWSWAAAATVLLAVGVAGWWQLHTPSVLEYHTAIGHQLSVSLEDGSTIELNTDTQIDVNYTDTERTVRLRRGEAHFLVEEDTTRPFVVLAGDGAVRAIGTAFNVYLTESQTVEVTVTEGIVEVMSVNRSPSRSGQVQDEVEAPTRVSQGQRIQYNGQVGAVAELPAPQVERRLAWRQGMLSFDGETLEEVVAEVSRYTNIEFVIADPRLRELQVGGYFKSTDIDALTDLLDTAFGVEARRNGQVIHLTQRPH